MLRSFKTILFLLLICTLTTPLLAQEKNWQDVVYLKNGSILRGKLAADTSGTTVKIETLGYNLFVFPAAEVAQVTREPISPLFHYPFTQGYLHLSEIGLSVGNSTGINQARNIDFSLQTFHGYQFASYFALGLTAGVDTYSWITLLPLGAGLRGDLTKTRVRPYYGLDAGYALDWLNNPMQPGNRQGGFFWSPGLGLKFSSLKSHAFLVNLTYRQQASTLIKPFGNGTSVTESKFKRILFRIGLSF